MPSPSRSLPWLITAAALAGALGLYLGQRHVAGNDAAASAPVQANTLIYPQPRPLDDFVLARSDGRAFTRADWLGQWNLVFIGFTHCPDACPQTLAVFREIRRRWPEGQGLPPAMYFVSVDPQRDTAAALRDYAGYFDPAIVAATGADDQLQAFARQLGMVYVHTPQDEGYTVDHSTHVAVVDPHGRMVAMMRPPHDAAAVVADLRALAAADAP